MKTKSHPVRNRRLQNLAFRKSFKLLFSALILGLLFGGVLLFKTAAPAQAASCTVPGTNYGTDTITTSSSGAALTAPATGTIDVWSRIQVPTTTNAAFMLQVTDTTTNTVTCFNTIGSSSIAANTWTWTDQNGSASSLAQITATSGDSLKLEYIGLQSGVQLDEFLLLPDSAQCTPTDAAGDPCTTASTTTGVTVPYYMMAGTSANYKDTTGITWLADQTTYLTTQNAYGSTGGLTKGGDGSTCTTSLANSNCTTHTIANATDSKVYQTERWGSFTYTIPVAAGSYNVVLKEAEINPPTSGTRSFNVTINGTQDLTNFTMPTAYTTDDQTFPVTVSSSGTDANEIVIAFATVSDTAKLSALEILPASQTPPTINLTAPTSGATVKGTQTLSAALGNTSGTTSVAYQVVSSTGATTAAGNSSTSPYSVSWNSTAVADGSYTLKATVTSNGQTATAQEPITVSNNTCTATPNPPTGVTDTDSSPLPANKVDLSWTAPLPATNCTIAGYNVYRTNGSTTTKLNSTGPVTGTTYADSTVSAATAYSYQVTTVYSSGTTTESAKSTPAVSVTTGQNCTQVSNGLSTPTLTQNTNITSYTQIGMTWTPSTTINGNGCTFSAYNLYRVVNGVAALIYNGTNTNFTDTGVGLTGNVLVQNTSYSYYVQAVDSGGNKVSSATVPMLTLKDTTAPTTPTIKGTPTATSNSVTLTWNPSSDQPNPGGVGVAGYNIYTSTAQNAVPVNGSTLITGTTYTVANLSSSTNYQFYIQAQDNNGNQDNLASLTAVPVTTLAATCSGTQTAVPTSFGGSQTTNSVTLTWGAPTTIPAGCTLQGYEIFKNNSALSQPVSPSILNFTDPNLTPGQYSYFIEALYTNGPASNPTSTKQFTIADTTAPTPPTSFTASSASPTQVQLSWSGASDNVGITSYVVTRSDKPTTTLATVTGTTSSYLDSTATASTTYTYTIKALDAAQNQSQAVTSNSVTTPAPTGQTPSPPSGLQSILITSNFVALTWNASNTATSYTIYRNGSPIGTTTSPEYSDSGLAYNTTYTYAVAAVNAAGSSSPTSGLQVETLSAPPINDLVGDITGPGGTPDGHVDILDLTKLLINWGKTNATYQQGDLDGDGTVTIRDLTTLLINWTG